MKIAHVTDCFLPRMGGIERQVHDLAVRQQEAGHTVEIITSVAGEPAGGRAKTADDVVAVEVIRPQPGRRGKYGRPGAVQYSKFTSGGAAVRAGKYDVVHVHASSLSPMAYHAARAACRAGIPAVITVHSLWSYAWPVFSASEKVMGWGDWPITWSAVSSVAASPLYRYLGPGERIAILPNAVERTDWQIQPLPRQTGRIVIVSVMRLAARKRPHQFLVMLRRARQLVPAGIRMEVVIIGDGPRERGMRRYLARHRMADWVRLVGRCTHDEIRELYRDADFFVAPATLESFGIAALEARSAGLPIIAQSVSGVRDFVTHGREGLLAVDDRDMADRIAQLATSPGMLATMTQHNRQQPPDFGWPEVLDRCAELYARAGATAVTEHGTEHGTEHVAEPFPGPVNADGTDDRPEDGPAQFTDQLTETARHA